jgi:hypothetical protein
MSATLDTPILDGAIRTVNFFNGRLLTARDLSRVQLAAEGSDERLGQVIGDGVAHGLEVNAPNPQAASPILRVQKGLALNRAGETLCLDAATDVALVQPPDDDAPGGGGFTDCRQVTGGTYVAGAGIYLLTICSARATEGRALTSGLDESAGKCNTDTVVRAVQFRLLQLDRFLLREDFYDVSRARGDHEIRNRVAYRCFGAAALAAFDTAPLSLDARAYGVLDALRAAGMLSDCDVPLTILYWTLTGGIRFVDGWAVRRRVTSPSPDGARAPQIGDRRLAEAEAMTLQFETQAEALRGELATNAPAAQVEQYFSALPPAAYLRVGPRAFDWKAFLGRHAPDTATPLAGGLARAVVLHAFGESAVPVVARSGSSAVQPVRYRVYEVDGRTDQVLLARSSFAQTVARDVHLDNNVCCYAGVDNVQDAINELCRRVSSCCTVVVGPAPGWQRAIAALPRGSDAEICFQTGTFTLDQTLEIAGLRHVKVTGAGFGTRLVANGLEVALVFRDCTSVAVRDLHAQTGVAGWGNAAMRDLGGALNFIDCASVTVENISTQCAAAAERAASCIVIRNTRPVAGRAALTDASVLHSRCSVGHAQIGILMVNVSRVRVENNDIALAADARLDPFAADPRHRARLRRQLLSIYAKDAPRGKAPPTFAREHVQQIAAEVSFGAVTVPIHTMLELRTVWTEIVAALQPKAITTAAQLAKFLKTIASEAARSGGTIAALRNANLANALKTSHDRLLRGAMPAAHQGIVVAGAAADDVRIRDNIIAGVEQGVHVGVSAGSRRHRETLKTGRVQVTGNTIEVVTSSLTSGERHAVFVGSCDSVVIEANAARLTSTAPKGVSLVEPLRLWGRFGRRLVVTGNHFDGFRRGIYLRPLGLSAPDVQLQWVVQHNFVTDVHTPVELHPATLTLAVGAPNFS